MLDFTDAYEYQLKEEYDSLNKRMDAVITLKYHKNELNIRITDDIFIDLMEDRAEQLEEVSYAGALDKIEDLEMEVSSLEDELRDKDNLIEELQEMLRHRQVC